MSETTILTVASTVGRLHVSSQRQDVAVSDKVERGEDSEDKRLTASSSTERPVPSMCM